MGLFSFVGKAIKGVAKVATGALKIGGALGLIPGGGVVGKLAGTLLGAKAGNTYAQKLALRDPRTMRGNATQAGRGAFSSIHGYRPSPAVLRMSPVMPGGAVATSSGMVARTASPPATFGGRAGAGPKRRRKKAATRTRSTTKRRGRKLKFGSPAWRKKYLKKRRRRAA